LYVKTHTENTVKLHRKKWWNKVFVWKQNYGIY